MINEFVRCTYVLAYAMWERRSVIIACVYHIQDRWIWVACMLCHLLQGLELVHSQSVNSSQNVFGERAHSPMSRIYI